jgi:hypothetical protein
MSPKRISEPELYRKIGHPETCVFGQDQGLNPWHVESGTCAAAGNSFWGKGNVLRKSNMPGSY